MTDEESELRKSWKQEIENNRALSEKLEKYEWALHKIKEHTVNADINEIINTALGEVQ